MNLDTSATGRAAEAEPVLYLPAPAAVSFRADDCEPVWAAAGSLALTRFRASVTFSSNTLEFGNSFYTHPKRSATQHIGKRQDEAGKRTVRPESSATPLFSRMTFLPAAASTNGKDQNDTTTKRDRGERG